MKQRAWSFSALDMFEKCRKKFYHLKVIKSHKEPDNQWQADGKFIHDAIFKYCTQGVPLPLTIRHMQGDADKIMRIPHDMIEGEMQLCLNAKFKPVAWFAKDAWVRAIVDLLLIKGNVAIIVDWKTGKQKPGFDQLKLTAAIVSRLMPEIDQFHLIYSWLKDSEITRTTIHKSELKQVWLNYMPRAKEMTTAEATTSFEANPTGLCGYCPITDCPHWFERE